LGDGEPEFQLKVKVPGDDGSMDFILPTSSYSTFRSNAKPYDWIIDWGDGIAANEKGEGSFNSGIPHTYDNADIYTITIKPNGETDAWLAAFGFGDKIFNLALDNSYSNSQINKNKAVEVISPITPNMMAPADRNGNDFKKYFEWSYAFYGCKNLKMGENFTFDQEAWKDVGNVGAGFAAHI
jgi:hypothetical protein